MKEIQAKVDALLPQTNNYLTCAIDCFEGPLMLIAAESDRQPAQFYVYTRATNSIVMLGSAHPAIAQAQMGMRDF